MERASASSTCAAVTRRSDAAVANVREEPHERPVLGEAQVLRVLRRAPRRGRASWSRTSTSSATADRSEAGSRWAPADPQPLGDPPHGGLDGTRTAATAWTLRRWRKFGRAGRACLGQRGLAVDPRSAEPEPGGPVRCGPDARTWRACSRSPRARTRADPEGAVVGLQGPLGRHSRRRSEHLLVALPAGSIGIGVASEAHVCPTRSSLRSSPLRRVARGAGGTDFVDVKACHGYHAPAGTRARGRCGGSTRTHAPAGGHRRDRRGLPRPRRGSRICVGDLVPHAPRGPVPPGSAVLNRLGRGPGRAHAHGPNGAAAPVSDLPRRVRLIHVTWGRLHLPRVQRPPPTRPPTGTGLPRTR